MNDEGRIKRYILRIRYAEGEKYLESDLPFPPIKVGEMVLWDYEETNLGEEVETIIHRFYFGGSVHELDVWLKGSAPM